MAKKEDQSIGVSIQRVAKTLQWLLIIIFVVIGIGVSVTSILAGIAVVALGVLIAFVSTMLLKGFGEMVEDIHCIRRSSAIQAEWFEHMKASKQKQNQ